MKHADLKVQTDDQLAGQLADLKKEQFNLRFQAATGQLSKPSRVRSTAALRSSRRFIRASAAIRLASASSIGTP